MSTAEAALERRPVRYFSDLKEFLIDTALGSSLIWLLHGLRKAAQNDLVPGPPPARRDVTIVLSGAATVTLSCTASLTVPPLAQIQTAEVAVQVAAQHTRR